MDKNREIPIVNISTIDKENSRLSASRLVMESLPAYYVVDGIDECEMASAVAAMLGKKGSEIEKGYAALYKGEVVGIFTFLYGEELPTARIVGTQTLFKHLSTDSARKFRNHLQHYNGGFGTVPRESIYLSRFAVDKDYRGSGLASRLLEVFLCLEDDNVRGRDQFSLHVDRDNERAIAFYSKHEFYMYHTGLRYLTMVCSQEGRCAPSKSTED